MTSTTLNTLPFTYENQENISSGDMHFWNFSNCKLDLSQIEIAGKHDHFIGSSKEKHATDLSQITLHDIEDIQFISDDNNFYLGDCEGNQHGVLSQKFRFVMHDDQLVQAPYYTLFWFIE